jgi:hypothetical protein
MPPTITHIPMSSANTGQPVAISAIITDNIGVTEANLHYRKDGDATYLSSPMTPSGNRFTGVIPMSAVTTTGVQYYINATDGTNFSTHPSDDPGDSPHAISVTPVNVKPTAATLSNPSDITKNSIKLVWTQNTEADFAQYEVYQSANSGTFGTRIGTITDLLTTSYTVTDLSENTTYYFTIRVVDTAGLFADSVQTSGTTESGADSISAWVLWSVAGVGVVLAAVTIALLVLRQRKK